MAPAGQSPFACHNHRSLDAGTHPVPGRFEYERMLVSPFGFFRGAAPVMAADLAALPSTGILSQICGDAHVRNLGAYAAPDGRLIFDINDFDETCAAPFEWDLKRMATSLVLAGRENGQKSSACRDAIHILALNYRRLAATLARTPVVELARYQVHRLQRVTPVSDALHKAERETPLSTLGRFTEVMKTDKAGRARRRFKEEPPLLTRLPQAQARAVLASFARYRDSLSAGAAALPRSICARGCRIQGGGYRQCGLARLPRVPGRQWRK